uniref:C-type lectin domain-containing protein n=1 Tax=Labrus bergylta TaxID=56723 RepID=A0A3Q3MD20_9LABR
MYLCKTRSECHQSWTGCSQTVTHCKKAKFISIHTAGNTTPTCLPSPMRIAYGFFCFNLMVDEVKKTWEEALEHCRETHTDLTNLNSETKRRLALSEIQHNHITKRVWIGLRFLGDRWLWLNGDPMVYKAWRNGDQEHQCPLRKRCGALTKEGHWENWDCEERLNFICY